MKMVNGKFMGKVIGTALAATMLIGSAGIVRADAWQMGLSHSTTGTSDSRVLIADHTDNYSSWCFYATEEGIYRIESKIITEGTGNQYIDPEILVYADGYVYLDDDSLDGVNFTIDVYLDADDCCQINTRADIYHGRSLGYYQVDIYPVVLESELEDEEVTEEIAPDYGMPDIDEEIPEEEETPADEELPEEIAPDYGMDLDEDTNEDEQIPEEIAPDYGMPEFDEDIIDETIDETEEITEEEETTDVEETTIETIEIDININIESEAVAETTPAPVVETVASTSTTSSTPAPMVAGVSRSPVEQFVDRLYSVALNRAADVDGRAYWVDSLSNQRESGSKVARGFIFSTEFISRDLDNEEFVETLYSVFFNRVATDDEIDNWVDALEAGASRSAVVNGFAASEEWANSCEAYGVTK